MDNNDLALKNKKIFPGILLLGIGTLLLAKNFGLYFPNWLISWPMLLIAIGIYKGFKYDFKRPSWLILITVGLVFLAERILPSLHIQNFIWPIVLIGIGVYFILFPNQQRKRYENC